MERLRVGVVGCGLIAQVMHLPYLRELGVRALRNRLHRCADVLSQGQPRLRDDSCADRRALSIGLVGNAAEVVPEIVRRVRAEPPRCVLVEIKGFFGSYHLAWWAVSCRCTITFSC